MTQHGANETYCLVLFMRPSDALSEVSLLSAKPYVDHWIICSTGVSEKEKDNIKNLMTGVSGEFLDYEGLNYGDAKTSLVSLAQQRADHVLVLNNNEQLICWSNSLASTSQNDVLMVNVMRANVTTREARVISKTTIANFTDPLGEHIDLENRNIGWGTQFYILNESAQPLAFNDPAAQHFVQQSSASGEPLNASDAMTLGKIEHANSHPDLALEHLNAALALEIDDNDRWMAHYLAGSIKLAENPMEALRHWHSAYELDVERAEPLMRLAEFYFDQNDFDTAIRLADAIERITEPPYADYFEPAIYSHTAQCLKARAWHKQGQTKAAIALLSDLTVHVSNESVKIEVQQILDEFKREIPAQTKSNEISPTPMPGFATANPILTIGMATHDDYDGVYFTVMSLVLYHQACLQDIEILIVDNNPDSKHGVAVRGLVDRVPQARYVAAGEYQGTAIRECVFQEALGDYVLCMDCHVFLHEGAVAHLLDYFKANPNSKDILHGPIFFDNHQHFSTHMTPEWSGGFYGRWASDERAKHSNSEPFDIPMQGLGLFACVKKHWPGFNLKFRGFGGEEGYIHEKFRQHGGRVLCLPFFRWTHRFDRPNAPTYPNSWNDRLRNYLLGWSELGMDIQPILQHFSALLGDSQTSTLYSHYLLERNSPLWQFDSIVLFNDKEFECPSLSGLGVQQLVQNIKSNHELATLLDRAIKRQLPYLLLVISKADSAPDLEAAIYQSMNEMSTWHAEDAARKLVDLPDLQIAYLTPAEMLKLQPLLMQTSPVDLKQVV